MKTGILTGIFTPPIETLLSLHKFNLTSVSAAGMQQHMSVRFICLTNAELDSHSIQP